MNIKNNKLTLLLLALLLGTSPLRAGDGLDIAFAIIGTACLAALTIPVVAVGATANYVYTKNQTDKLNTSYTNNYGIVPSALRTANECEQAIEKAVSIKTSLAQNNTDNNLITTELTQKAELWHEFENELKHQYKKCLEYADLSLQNKLHYLSGNQNSILSKKEFYSPFKLKQTDLDQKLTAIKEQALDLDLTKLQIQSKLKKIANHKSICDFNKSAKKAQFDAIKILAVQNHIKEPILSFVN